MTVACGNVQAHRQYAADAAGFEVTDIDRGYQFLHNNADEVRTCYARTRAGEWVLPDLGTLAEWEAEHRAEAAAEMAAERWFEERGGMYPNEYEEALMAVNAGGLPPLQFL